MSHGQVYGRTGSDTQLQADLKKIIALFQEVGLHANESKTKFMVVRGAPVSRALLKVVYDGIADRRKGKKTMKYNQRRKMKVQCTICQRTLQQVSLKRHMIQQHVVNNYEYKCREVADTGLYTVSQFVNHRDNPCPISNCSGGGTTTWSMYRHFAQRHPEADIIIDIDGELPKCEKCMMRCKNL